MNQRGFATLEVILMVVVIGILASVAVPRFTDVTTKANTAKIQADLTTIDTAIQMYEMDGKDLTKLSIPNLKSEGYLMDVPTPPTGSAYVKGTDGTSTSTPISTINTTSEYTIDDYTISGTGTSAKTVKRAKLGDKVAGDFGVK